MVSYSAYVFPGANAHIGVTRIIVYIFRFVLGVGQITTLRINYLAVVSDFVGIFNGWNGDICYDICIVLDIHCIVLLVEFQDIWEPHYSVCVAQCLNIGWSIWSHLRRH